MMEKISKFQIFPSKNFDRNCYHFKDIFEKLYREKLEIRMITMNAQ